MSGDLLNVLDSATPDTTNIGHAIIHDNLLGKPTASGRQIAFQRLKELYGVDPTNQLFRVLLKLYRMDRDAVAQLALLAALARDPLLRATAVTYLTLRTRDSGFGSGLSDTQGSVIPSRRAAASISEASMNSLSS